MRVNVKKLTDEIKERFVKGYREAGGLMCDEDKNSSSWCAPWRRPGITIIKVDGTNPEEWGASWWRKNRKEIEAST